MITSELTITEKKDDDYLSESKVHRAVILTAGFCMRMVLINTEIPNGVVEVRGEKLSKQIHAVNIKGC